MSPRQRLIVALDLPERDRILELARAVGPSVAYVKLGLEGFVGHGPELVRELRDAGLEVFLDLKLHDIPRTVAAACRQLASLDVGLVTVHAQGGAAMLRAARDALPPSCRLIAVTVLTSLDAAALARLGVSEAIASYAARLAAEARAAGADGLVCSAHELRALAAYGGVRVVPGVRPLGGAADDQKRVVTAAEAVRQGADYLVVGRPIVEAASPAEAARQLAAEIAAAQEETFAH